MIYLIGGPPRCGKTTLARALSKQLNISYVPADYLMSVISQYIPADEAAERLPRWQARQLTAGSNDRLYSEYSSQQLVDFYLKEAETYWPGIKNFILYALHDNHDFIIEGGQLLPAFIKELINEHGSDSFSPVFLIKSGEAIAEGLKASTHPNDWAKRDTSEETYPRIGQMIHEFGQKIKGECSRLALPCYDVTDNFIGQMEDLTQKLTEKSNG